MPSVDTSRRFAGAGPWDDDGLSRTRLTPVLDGDLVRRPRRGASLLRVPRRRDVPAGQAADWAAGGARARVRRRRWRAVRTPRRRGGGCRGGRCGCRGRRRQALGGPAGLAGLAASRRPCPSVRWRALFPGRFPWPAGAGGRGRRCPLPRCPTRARCSTRRSVSGVAEPSVHDDPFALLGLPARAGLSDDDVRAAWRRIAAATHPDREDGGDPARFGAAAAAYVTLRTSFGRGEALADLGDAAPTGAARRPGRHRGRRGRSATGPRAPAGGRLRDGRRPGCGRRRMAERRRRAGARDGATRVRRSPDASPGRREQARLGAGGAGHRGRGGWGGGVPRRRVEPGDGGRARRGGDLAVIARLRA